MSGRTAIVILLAATCLVALGTSASAATYLVRPNGSGDYATIQDAIDAVVGTDIIELASGTFDGTGNRDMDFLGKAITIQSQSGDPSEVTIDCDGGEFDPHRAFWFHTGEGSSSVLRNVSIVNGFMTDENGGAILCESASPTIEGCVFGSNTIAGTGVKGGALYCTGTSTPAITGCRFLGNAAGESTSGMGGAIALEDGADATITDTVIDGNYCGFMGGGIFTSHCDLTLTDCTIADNGAGAGAGVRAFDGTFVFSGCSFLWNEATGTGDGGAILAQMGTYDISDCSIMGNWASGDGGGIHFTYDATGSVANSIVAFSLRGGGIYVGTDSRATPTITCSDVFENTGGNYVGDITDQTGSNNNISLDPQFCDAPSGDLTLYNTSPCASEYSPCALLIGAEDVDCFSVTEPSSWGKIKATYE